MQLKIISRKSTLARIQAQQVAKEILKLDSSIRIEFISKETQGDIDLTTPLHQMTDTGVFTRDMKEELLSNNADIAIHSWKDLPVELEPGTKIVGTLHRADMRDMLFLKKKSKDNKIQDIYSSSPRREKNLKYFLPEALPTTDSIINFRSIRGNILTRFKKLRTSDNDGLIVAKAAIDRLIQDETGDFLKEKKELKIIIQNMLWMVIPLSVNPCAAAQGAIAIEAKIDNTKVIELIQKISDKNTFEDVEREREILKSYGGGCHQKIGASLERVKRGQVLTVRGETEEGKEINIRTFTPNLDRKNFFKGVSINSIYPQKNVKTNFFKRKNIPSANKLIKDIENKGVYVSRSNALEKNLTINKSNCIWVSGIDTWISLAKSGNWVNGSSDSLGELESPPVNPFKEIEWYKLSHEMNKESKFKTITTYELIPLEIDTSIKNKTHFFWMSATSFKEAIRIFPELIEAKHATGLGKSFDIIQGIAGKDVQPFLNYQDWLNQVEDNI